MEESEPTPGGGASPAGGADIPDKLFFRIGEVSHLVGVEAHVLRYWESEFKPLTPRKSSSGQRMFRRQDVELLLRIKYLLYECKFTIEGARQWLARHPATDPAREPRDSLSGIRQEVAEILKLLKS